MEGQNIKIAGSGTVTEGKYNVISIAGSGVGNGQIECKTLKTAGSAKFHGNVIAEDVDLAGSTKFQQNLKGVKINASGTLKVCGNLEAENIKTAGAVSVEGEMNVGILFHKGEGSSFNNIYGDCITLEGRKRKHITVNEIEATNINLYCVKAIRISGDNVKVTGNSVVDIIEFKQSLKISKNVTVKEIIKL